MRELPLAVDDPERDVFVRRAGAEVQQHGLVVARLLDDLVRRRLGLVDEVRVEDVELVALHDLGRRVVRAAKRKRAVVSLGTERGEIHTTVCMRGQGRERSTYS